MGQSNRNEEGRMGLGRAEEREREDTLSSPLPLKTSPPGSFSSIVQYVCASSLLLAFPHFLDVLYGRLTQPRARATVSPLAEISPARKDALAAGGLQ